MPIFSSRSGMPIMFTMRKLRLFSQLRSKMAGPHARSRKMPSSASSATPITPRGLVPHRLPDNSCKNSSANLDTNFGMIPFRSSTRKNSQPCPVQKISQTITSSLSRLKIAENSLLSTKESTRLYCKVAFPPIMLFKTILECKNPINFVNPEFSGVNHRGHSEHRG